MVDQFLEDKTTKLNLAEMKSGGFIKQRQKDLFTIRLRVPGGRLLLKKLKKIIEVAEKYGADYVHLSVRPSVEIPYVNIKDIDALRKELEEVGQKIASCGPRVRVPTACSGCEYNPNGLMDVQKWCLAVDEKFFGMPTGHHKFKISFSGCPIDCFRTTEMDLGFQGQMEPKWNEETCVGCTLCAKACQEGAIVSDKDGKPVYDASKCIYCADCIRVCPTESWMENKRGWAVRVGGKHGRHPLAAFKVADLVPDSKTFEIIEKTVKWYKENGIGRERIGETIRRLGVEKFKEDVLSNGSKT